MLSKQAIGVLDTCCNCRGTGMVMQPCKPDPKTGERQFGFEQVPCADYSQGVMESETCHGTGKRRIHNPAPNELPGNISVATVNRTLREQVAYVLNGVLC